MEARLQQGVTVSGLKKMSSLLQIATGLRESRFKPLKQPVRGGLGGLIAPFVGCVDHCIYTGREINRLVFAPPRAEHSEQDKLR